MTPKKIKKSDVRIGQEVLIIYYQKHRLKRVQGVVTDIRRDENHLNHYEFKLDTLPNWVQAYEVKTIGEQRQ